MQHYILSVMVARTIGASEIVETYFHEPKVCWKKGADSQIFLLQVNL